MIYIFIFIYIHRESVVYLYKIHCCVYLNTLYAIKIQRTPNKFVICCIFLHYRISASVLYSVHLYKLLYLILFCNPLFFLQNTAAERVFRLGFDLQWVKKIRTTVNFRNLTVVDYRTRKNLIWGPCRAF